MGFTGNPSGVRKVLLVVIALFLCGALGWCAHRANADELPDKGLTVGFGQAAAGGELCMNSFALSQELDNKRWLAYMATHGTGVCKEGEHFRANLLGSMLRTTHLGSWAIGFGVGAAEHGDTIVGPETLREWKNWPEPRTADRIQLCANILVRRYLFRERAVFDFFHCSTGGSTYYNTGLNVITLGIRVR